MNIKDTPKYGALWAMWLNRQGATNYINFDTVYLLILFMGKNQLNKLKYSCFLYAYNYVVLNATGFM